jgi:hypothetical protein
MKYDAGCPSNINALLAVAAVVDDIATLALVAMSALTACNDVVDIVAELAVVAKSAIFACATVEIGPISCHVVPSNALSTLVELFHQI